MAAGCVFVTDKSDSHSTIGEMLGTRAGERTSAAVIRLSLIACARDSEHAKLARNATASEAPSVQDVHASFEAFA